MMYNPLCLVGHEPVSVCPVKAQTGVRVCMCIRKSEEVRLCVEVTENEEDIKRKRAIKENKNKQRAPFRSSPQTHHSG